MRLLKKTTNFDFMGKGRLAIGLSACLLLVCLLSLALRGLNLGLDFTGGTVIEVGYPEPVAIPAVREALEAAGMGDAQAQHFGTAREVLIRLGPRESGLSSAQMSTRVLQALDPTGAAGMEMRRVEYVGPQIGDELMEDGGLAMLLAVIGILLYLALRFEWRLAVGAIAATVHDVLLVIGLYSLLQLEFDLTILAAVLAVIGYSVNDTVVVFDRIRENFRRVRKGSAREVVNGAVNQTLARTIVTSFTTLLALVALFIFGGAIIHGFALAMIIGILVGTYSSVYIASTLALELGLKREDMLPRAKVEVDERP